MKRWWIVALVVLLCAGCQWARYNEKWTQTPQSVDTRSEAGSKSTVNEPVWNDTPPGATRIKGWVDTNGVLTLVMPDGTHIRLHPETGMPADGQEVPNGEDK